MSSLEGKVALVTGAGSGIGRASAVAMAEAGARVVAADVDVKGAEETAARINDDPGAGGVRAVECDVSEADDVRRAVEHVVDEHGRLDVAHNNAGIEGPLAKLPDVEEADFDQVIAVNLKGVFLGLKHQIPVMAENGGGSIVNTASVAGLRANQGAAPYAASKHGVVGLTKTAAAEWASEGVRVNAICPGWTETPMVDRTDEKNPRVREAYEAQVPANRVAEPEEVASLVVYLAGDEAGYVNGAAVPIDGGWTAV